MARTAAQRAASIKNLEKARAERARGVRGESTRFRAKRASVRTQRGKASGMSELQMARSHRAMKTGRNPRARGTASTAMPGVKVSRSGATSGGKRFALARAMRKTGDPQRDLNISRGRRFAKHGKSRDGGWRTRSSRRRLGLDHQGNLLPPGESVGVDGKRNPAKQVKTRRGGGKLKTGTQVEVRSSRQNQIHGGGRGGRSETRKVMEVASVTSEGTYKLRKPGSTTKGGVVEHKRATLARVAAPGMTKRGRPKRTMAQRAAGARGGSTAAMTGSAPPSAVKGFKPGTGRFKSSKTPAQRAAEAKTQARMDAHRRANEDKLGAFARAQPGRPTLPSTRNPRKPAGKFSARLAAKGGSDRRSQKARVNRGIARRVGVADSKARKANAAHFKQSEAMDRAVRSARGISGPVEHSAYSVLDNLANKRSAANRRAGSRKRKFHFENGRRI